MIRSILAALALMAGPAWAGADSNGEAQALSQLWYLAQMMCYQNETHFAPVSAATSDAACTYRDDFTADLLAHGWCFDKSEQEWAAKCPIVPVSPE